MVIFATGVERRHRDRGNTRLSGKPLGEPIAWRGPIVMNTDEELRQAFSEFRNGTFIKHGANRT